MAGRSNFKIKRTIGGGGMSTVYLAKDIRLDRDVAVKVLRIDPQLGLGEKGRRELILRFQQEAKAAARLNHPNIVSIFHVGQQGEQYYIIMEYLEGDSLGQLAKSGERYSADTILKWMYQVCDGLHFAHENGVVHRDIKPDNLILLKNGTVKITDFGIARLEQSEMVKTKDQTFMGTIYYCSPEQLREFKSIDRRTDIYSSGVVLYQLLTGTLPFHEASIAETIDSIINGEPVPPRKIAPEIPVRLERIVLKCLAKDPAHRFQTAGELKDALLESISFEPEPVRTPRRDTGRAPARKSQTTILFRLSLTIGLILMIAAFLFGYFIIESKKSILQKDAAIRGRHISHMLSLLVNDASIGGNKEIFHRYVEEIGRDAQLVFVEMMREGQVIAGYHAEQLTAEQDVLMMSYPISDGPVVEILRIGFSKATMNRQVTRIKVGVGLAFAGIGLFLILMFLIVRLRARGEARNFQ
jgi:serine/threonine protein kinase